LISQFRMDYGLTSRVTLSAGVEFLSSLEENPVIPFLETSLRLPYNTMLSGQYFHDVGYKGNFSYVGLSGVRLDLNYAKFEQEQQVVRFNFQEERRANLSIPLKFGRFQGTTRLIYRQNLFLANTYTHMEWLLSGRALGLRMNLTTTAFFSELSEPLILSAISTSIRLPKKVIFSPLMEYDFTNSRINSIRAELRTQIAQGIFLQSSYNHNFRYDQFFFNLGVNFEFGFSRLGLNSSTSGQLTSFSQSLGGSLLYEAEANHLRFENNTMIGRGGIKFSPFLDLNGNGMKDENEVEVEGIEVRSFSGGIKEKHPDGSTVFSGLEPYLEYHFKMDSRNLDRIAWRLEKESMNIFVNPNHMTLIRIPVIIVGEVGGFVYEGEEGVGGIKVNIFNEKGILITTMISETDGYFSFLGLKSGNYSAQPDRSQLQKLRKTEMDSIVFTIINGQDGDIADNLEFVIKDENNLSEQ
ncbi:MAG TPA: SdrD B-like domain-containing protein, partial [Gillisia sp.]|nr:SdrD B-like domain-containing protein [Gillisia sp.]